MTAMPEIHKMLVLSTAHLKRSTASSFEVRDDDVPLFYEKGEHGWLVPIIAGRSFPHTCPLELFVIRGYAEAAGCTWIMFDQDADVVDGLPTWEW